MYVIYITIFKANKTRIKQINYVGKMTYSSGSLDRTDKSYSSRFCTCSLSYQCAQFPSKVLYRIHEGVNIKRNCAYLVS